VQIYGKIESLEDESGYFFPNGANNTEKYPRKAKKTMNDKPKTLNFYIPLPPQKQK
jgi:hypothetical protein